MGETSNAQFVYDVRITADSYSKEMASSWMAWFDRVDERIDGESFWTVADLFLTAAEPMLNFMFKVPILDLLCYISIYAKVLSIPCKCTIFRFSWIFFFFLINQIAFSHGLMVQKWHFHWDYFAPPKTFGPNISHKTANATNISLKYEKFNVQKITVPFCREQKSRVVHIKLT